MKAKTVLSAVAAIVTSALVIGCATTSLVQNTCNTSAVLVPVAVEVGLQYGVQNPAERAQIENQMHVVSENVATLAKSGAFDIQSVEAAFSSTNPIVNMVFQPILALYENSFSQMQSSNEWIDAATQILQCISEDVASATTPQALTNTVLRLQARKPGTPRYLPQK